jgi:putative oxidoreductase
MAVFGKLSRYNDFGLLLLRIGIGAMMIWHGFPKLRGGPEFWEKIGGAMARYGVHDFPQFWGFMAGFTEAVGGLLFLLGFLFRPACLFLIFMMITAAMQSFGMGGMAAASHPIELGIVFVAMFIIGPGRYSIDKR